MVTFKRSLRNCETSKNYLRLTVAPSVIIKTVMCRRITSAHESGCWWNLGWDGMGFQSPCEWDLFSLGATWQINGMLSTADPHGPSATHLLSTFQKSHSAHFRKCGNSTVKTVRNPRPNSSRPPPCPSIPGHRWHGSGIWSNKNPCLNNPTTEPFRGPLSWEP